MAPITESVKYEVAIANIEWKQALSIALFIMLQILIFVLIISLKSKACRTKCSKQNTEPSGRYFFISFIVALLSFYINCLVVLYVTFSMERISANNNFPVFAVLTSLPYDYGRMIMEVFYILRLYFIFGSTASNIKPCVLTILVIASILAFLLGCTASVLAAFGIVQYDAISPIYFRFTSVVIGSIVSCVVIYLFIRTLHKLNVEMTFNSNSQFADLVLMDQDTIVDDMDIELADKEMRMIILITKNALLGMIGLTSTVLVYGFVIFEWIFQPETDALALRILENIDGTVNSICMCLIFSWSSVVYNKVCNCCDGEMKKCSIWMTKKSVRRRISQSVDRRNLQSVRQSN